MLLKCSKEGKSKIISENANRPKVLFKSSTAFLNATQETCEDLKRFFIHKVERIKGAIIPSHVHQPLIFRLCSSLNHFELVSTVQVSDIALKMKCSSCKLDVLSPNFF